MMIPRLFSVALAACAFTSPALATEDSISEPATALTSPTKPTDLILALDACDPALTASCADAGQSAPVAAQTLEGPVVKQPSEQIDD